LPCCEADAHDWHNGSRALIACDCGFFGLNGGFRAENRSLSGQYLPFAGSNWLPKSRQSASKVTVRTHRILIGSEPAD
jgi:hypothetical protein